MTSVNRVTLDSISESIDYGVTASAVLTPEGPKFLRITDIQDDRVNWDSVPWCECDERSHLAAKLKPGDIVFARTGATTGKSFLIRACPSDAVFASYLIRVRVKKGVDSSYVSHFFKSNDYWAQIAKSARGAAQPGVNATTLKSLNLPLPPIEEQRRIAAILDQADALRSKRREALAQLDCLAQSIFVKMFGDPVANPMGWEKKSFESVCPTRLGKMLDQKKSTGIHLRKYLRNANVQWFKFDLSDLLEMDFDPAERSKFNLREGDLLICEGGEPGRAAIWRGELTECYYQKALHRGRPDLRVSTPEYLVWLLWTLSRRGGLDDHITSATIAHLTGEKLKAMQVPMPPIELQKEFKQVVEGHELLRMKYVSADAAQEKLFACLQHQAFYGGFSGRTTSSYDN